LSDAITLFYLNGKPRILGRTVALNLDVQKSERFDMRKWMDHGGNHAITLSFEIKFSENPETFQAVD
jgi:hypothetical protein